MCDAVESAPGTDPDRAGFTIAYQAARDQVVLAKPPAPAEPWRIGQIGARVLAGLLPPRRARVSARTVKVGNSRYHGVKPDGRPLTSQHVTALQIAVHEPPIPAPPGPLPASGADPVRVGTRRTPKAGRINRVLDLLRHQPERVWRALEIAEYLHETNITSLRVQLSKYAQAGIIHKTAPATYTLLTTNPEP
jgi:hypothetical protein